MNTLFPGVFQRCRPQQFGADELCPGSAALDKINASLR